MASPNTMVLTGDTSHRLRCPLAILFLSREGGYAGSGGLTRALKDFVISGA